MVDKDRVDYVANLAKIAIAQEQKDFFARQLAKIINYIDKLKELKVEEVEPLRGFYQERNVLRKDVVKPSNIKDDILNNAPSRQGDYFKIPRVID